MADALYRFTVKCDREGNRTVERLAAERGMSPTTFVQKHFETLFGAAEIGLLRVPGAPAEPEEAEASTLPADFPEAPRYDDPDFDLVEGA